MAKHALPDMGDVDPTDPDGFVRTFLARYFTPGLVDSYIRTLVPAALAYTLSWLVLHFDWLTQLGVPAHPSTTFTQTATLAAIAGWYVLARLVERKWPRVGRWLIALNLTKTRPVYVTPKAAPAVEDAAAQPAPRV